MSNSQLTKTLVKTYEKPYYTLESILSDAIQADNNQEFFETENPGFCSERIILITDRKPKYWLQIKIFQWRQ